MMERVAICGFERKSNLGHVEAVRDELWRYSLVLVEGFGRPLVGCVGLGCFEDSCAWASKNTLLRVLRACMTCRSAYQ